MDEPTAVSWSCPTCGRRVPLRASACHCGMTWERASQVAAPLTARPVVRPATSTRGKAALTVWRSFPADIKVFAVAAALVLVSGLGWTIFGPGKPNTTPPLLGYVDSLPPAPTPKPSPPFKLPWWR